MTGRQPPTGPDGPLHAVSDPFSPAVIAAGLSGLTAALAWHGQWLLAVLLGTGALASGAQALREHRARHHHPHDSRCAR